MWFSYVFLVPIFRTLVFKVVGFFSIFQLIGDTTLSSVTILKQTYKRKNNFQDQISFCFDAINRHYFIKVIIAVNFNFILWLTLEILKEECNHMYVYYTTKRCALKGSIKWINKITASEMWIWKNTRGRFSTP